MKMTTIVMLLSALFVTGLWGHGQMVRKQSAELQAKWNREDNDKLIVELNGLRESVKDCLELREDIDLKNDEIEYLQQFIKECSRLRDEMKGMGEAFQEELGRKTREFQTALDKKDKEIASKNKTIRALGRPKKESISPDKRIMTLTAYTLSPDECGPDLTPALSSSKAVAGETAAVSPDLSHWLGKKVHIEGFGIRLINDLTSERFTNRVDILVASKAEAFKIGCKSGIQVCPVM